MLNSKRFVAFLIVTGIQLGLIEQVLIMNHKLQQPISLSELGLCFGALVITSVAYGFSETRRPSNTRSETRDL